MKKVLSVILTMAMLLSMFSCLFTTSAAAETSNSVVIQDFESYTPAAEGVTSYPINPDGSDSLDTTNRTNYNCVVKTDDTKYLNIWGFVPPNGKSVFYITNKTQTGLLDTNSTVYNLTFRYRLNKGTATATGTAVSIKVQNQVNNQNTLGEVALTYSGSDVWKTATIKNIVPTDNGYVRMRIEGGNDGMSIDIDDIAFTEAVTASATANGIGTAKVNNTTPVYGTEMVYTAKTANTFLGWFDGVNPDPVSTNKVYTFTYNGTQPVALTAKFEGSTIVQDFETGFVQNNQQVDRAPDSQTSKPIYGCTVKTDDTTYLNIAGISLGAKNIQYLTNAEETGMLDPAKTYTFTFMYRINKPDDVIMSKAVTFKLQTQNTNVVLGTADKWYPNDGFVWKEAKFENVAPVSTDLYTKLNISGAVDGVSVDIDDCVFTEVVPAVSTSVTVDGKLGTASVDKAEVKVGDTVTYTAKEFLANKFLGWYAGETLVSNALVYSFKYDGAKALDLTAKFKSDVIAQTFETGWDSSDRKPADNLTSKPYAPTAKTEANGNKYIQVEASGKWLHYVINEAETGLLDTEKKYNVTFKYKILTATENAVRVHFWNESETGSATQDWESITYNGGAGALGVTLEYNAEAADTWQTATIYNVKTTDYTTGRLAAYVSNAAGVQFAIDEIVFTEYKEEPAVSTSVTVEGTTGNATVDKAKVKKGETVTYTATENIAGAFLGWFDGANPDPVSTNKVYTFTYTGAEALALTAKFAAAYNTSVAVEGKLGTATVDKAEIVKGNTVTYTATEYLAGAFLGWYDSKGKVPADKEYTFTYDGTQELGLTAKFRTDIIAQTFETGFTTNDNSRDPDGKGGKGNYGTLVTENGNSYWNVSNFFGTSPKNIQYLTNAAETGMLDATKTYTLTFKFRIHNPTADTMDKAVVFKLQTQNNNNVLGQQIERWHREDETEWRPATITGIVPNANDLYTKLNISGGIEGITVDIDDCVFTEVIPTFDTSVTVDGKLGTASVDKAEVKVGDTVTYTAKEFLANKFLGWYAGETLVSNALVYSFEYDGAKALDLTAKFKSDVIAQTFETGWDSSDRKPADNLTSKPYAPVASTEANGNKYIQVEASGKWLHYVINEAETGLLDTEKKYNVTFKYKILTATENAVRVHFWNESETGSATQDWESITYNGGAGALGVILEYNAEAADTWQTATIYNVKTTDYETGRLAAYVSNAAGVQFAIDEIVFTETFIANASANGAGNAQVSKRYVEKGDTVTFTATANDNGEFVAWYDSEGNEVSTDATYTVTDFDGTQIINLTAKFKTLVTGSANIDNVDNGTVTITPSKFELGDTVTFAATEARENSFIGWFDAEGILVSTNKEFNVVYDGVEKLNYTAKYANADGTYDAKAFEQAFKKQFVKFEGTAMRAQDGDKPQALRFKTTIKARDLLAANGFVGAKIVEYGTLIGNTKKLAGAALTHATEGHLIGVAYNSAEDIDIVFENNNGDIQFTAALTGIKAKNYADRLTMRAYIVLDNGAIIYADQYDYSVFDVMCAIKLGNKAEDIAIVDGILDADPDVKAAFEEYQAANDFVAKTAKETVLEGLDAKMYDLGLGYKGNSARIAELMKKAENGGSYTIGVLGGSITQGATTKTTETSSSIDNRYANRVLAWWQANFPNAEFTLVNAGIGSTNPQMASYRLDTDLLSYNPDFVVVDFAVNTYLDYDLSNTYDNLIYRILTSTNSPAVMAITFTQVEENSYDGSQTEADPTKNTKKKEFPDTAIMNTLKKYDIPMMSYHNYVWNYLDAGLILWPEIAADYIHPNNAGHLIASRLISSHLSYVKDNLDYISTESAEVPAPNSEKYLDVQYITVASDKVVSNTGFVAGDNTDPTKRGWSFSGGADAELVITLPEEYTEVSLFMTLKDADGGVKVVGADTTNIDANAAKTPTLVSLGNKGNQITITPEFSTGELKIYGICVR